MAVVGISFSKYMTLYTEGNNFLLFMRNLGVAYKKCDIVSEMLSHYLTIL